MLYRKEQLNIIKIGNNLSGTEAKTIKNVNNRREQLNMVKAKTTKFCVTMIWDNSILF